MMSCDLGFNDEDIRIDEDFILEISATITIFSEMALKTAERYCDLKGIEVIEKDELRKALIYETFEFVNQCEQYPADARLAYLEMKRELYESLYDDDDESSSNDSEHYDNLKNFSSMPSIDNDEEFLRKIEKYEDEWDDWEPS